MSAGLILTFLVYALLLVVLVAVALILPKSLLRQPAKAVLKWLPPFLGGTALRDWAAATAEQQARNRLAGPRTGDTANRLAAEMEAAAMQAMVPLGEPAELDRIIACPETGQGRIGVTGPEALAIAAYIRKSKPRAEQQRIYLSAVENAKKIGARAPEDLTPYPCALQGEDHVCCAFAQRPLRCRPLHAIVIRTEMGRQDEPAAPSIEKRPATSSHEQTVAHGIEIGLRRALDSAGLDPKIYELNSALATALGTPDAADRWARGEDVFRQTFR